jgi:ELWxxDGT repeat protein
VGEELWVTDGTAAGTLFVKDINTETIATGTANSAIDGMINFYNEKLFLKAFSIESNNEPWASDGTPAGTYQIFDSNNTFEDNGFPRGGGASDAGAFPYNGKVYFRGWSMTAGCELGSTDLTADTMTVFDINTNEPSVNNHSYPDPGVEFDGVYMFCAASGFDAAKPNNYGGELWYTDGTTVTMQSDMGPGTLSNWVKELTVVSGSLYWWNESGETPEHKQKLFRIDSKTQFPVRVTDMNPDGDRINTLRNLGGDLLFQTSNNHQLYCYHYRKDGFNPATETDDLSIEFRTRAEIATGVPTYKSANTLVAYPNPAENVLNFAGVTGEKEIRIFNLLGETVKSQKSTGAIDVSALQSGVYFLQVENQSVRFVKK